MKVGIPKEIKNNENRVGMTPSGVLLKLTMLFSGASTTELRRNME